MHRLALILTLTLALPANAAPRASLADAVEHRDTAALAELLTKKSDPNVPQVDGMTALHWAAHHDDLKTARRLLAAGADAKARTRYGVTAVSLACSNGNAALVELLLKHGADPNTTLAGGETALMTASRTGKLPAVKVLLAHGAKVDARERYDQSAVMWAAHEGHADVVDALIRAGADFKTPNRGSFTPLLFAARQGHIAVARRLIEAGVDVNQAMTKVRGGRNRPVKNTAPLLMAMENGHFELAVVLLEAGADPNDMRTGAAPLHAMSWIRKPMKGDGESGTPPPIGSGRITSLQFVRKLVEHGAKLELRLPDKHERIRRGATPLLAAAQTADTAFMKLLLELGADPKARDSGGHTALLLAAGITEGPEGDGPATFDEHYEAVSFLLDLGADINATNKGGETAMHAAAYKMAPNVVNLLHRRGADIKLWTTKARSGRTPLSIAQGYRPGNFKPSPDTIAAIKKIMIANGITPPPPPKNRDEKWRN